MALSGAVRGCVLSKEQFSEVWTALWQALENSEQQMDFSEFKHAASLKEQASMTHTECVSMLSALKNKCDTECVSMTQPP